METISVVVFITLTFAAVNLLAQLAALEYIRRDQTPRLAGPRLALEHPFHSRIEAMPSTRTHTDRRDLQLGIGQDFAAPDAQDSVWPRDPRY